MLKKLLLCSAACVLSQNPYGMASYSSSSSSSSSYDYEATDQIRNPSSIAVSTSSSPNYNQMDEATFIQRINQFNNPTDQLNLAMAYHTGTPLITKENVKYTNMMFKSAQNILNNTSNPNLYLETVKYHMGHIYEEGLGVVKKDLDKATLWHDRNTVFTTLLALLSIAERDFDSDVSFFNNPHYNLGLLNLSEEYLKRKKENPLYAKTAFDICELAAKRGYLPAQNRLGTFYKDGTGVEKNYLDSTNWFLRSIENEDKCALPDGYPDPVTEIIELYDLICKVTKREDLIKINPWNDGIRHATPNQMEEIIGCKWLDISSLYAESGRLIDAYFCSNKAAKYKQSFEMPTIKLEETDTNGRDGEEWYKFASLSAIGGTRNLSEIAKCLLMSIQVTPKEERSQEYFLNAKKALLVLNCLSPYQKKRLSDETQLTDTFLGSIWTSWGEAHYNKITKLIKDKKTYMKKGSEISFFFFQKGAESGDIKAQALLSQGITIGDSEFYTQDYVKRAEWALQALKNISKIRGNTTNSSSSSNSTEIDPDISIYKENDLVKFTKMAKNSIEQLYEETAEKLKQTAEKLEQTAEKWKQTIVINEEMILEAEKDQLTLSIPSSIN